MDSQIVDYQLPDTVIIITPVIESDRFLRLYLLTSCDGWASNIDSKISTHTQIENNEKSPLTNTNASIYGFNL